MLRSIQAVIFDADGTLVDSEEPGMDVLFELAQAQGLQLSREAAHQQFRGVRMADCIAWIAAQLPHVPPGFEADFMAQVRLHTDIRFRQGLLPLPGALALLQSLQLPFCVATNGPREKVELTLGLTGLRPLFGDRIFCAYEVGHFKPDPGLFLHAAQALGIAPEHCAVVEDSLPGVQAGLAAGMQVFCLHPREGLPADIAERVTFIEGLDALPPLLARG
ncbi:HAD superfamily hydrolase (TIGR01509 family) [Rhodoferax ferrireducens]|uniref:HAD superfamily hydrolase (TIGR01509 family) n=1 Tax=Rhodoferax ferrireducens TaxID=192843 RepID=A0ABU2C7X6_9BURK|nr:HAD-IA family hydrolase [Rhodoferax ferrireducens]MDR7377439.1 HAD superfamily hydrolase (TIGR01509 family) [Rhodoferax ferrireducens]